MRVDVSSFSSYYYLEDWRIDVFTGHMCQMATKNQQPYQNQRKEIFGNSKALRKSTIFGVFLIIVTVSFMYL